MSLEQRFTLDVAEEKPNKVIMTYEGQTIVWELQDFFDYMDSWKDSREDIERAFYQTRDK